jgi:hypothetical protein
MAGGQSVLPGIQVGKIELIVVKGALPHRPAATRSSIFSFCRNSLLISMKESDHEQESSQRGFKRCRR